jgi:hypothetical protein
MFYFSMGPRESVAITSNSRIHFWTVAQTIEVHMTTRVDSTHAVAYSGTEWCLVVGSGDFVFGFGPASFYRVSRT